MEPFFLLNTLSFHSVFSRFVVSSKRNSNFQSLVAITVIEEEESVLKNK